MELETHMIVAVRLQLIEKDQAMPVWQITLQAGRMLTQLIKSLEEKNRASE